METEAQFPQTFVEAARYFGEDDNAFNFMVTLRWPNGVCCPRCGSAAVGYISTRKMWECKSTHPKRQFTVKVGTIFEDSALGLDKWLLAMWLISNAKNGISSHELGRTLGVTQKTAWFMLHRIRLALQSGSIEKLSGEVEVDETFIGGKVRNMKGERKVRAYQYGRPGGGLGKAIVLGMLERGGRAKVMHVPHRRKSQLVTKVKANVAPGSVVYSDALNSYRPLHVDYRHAVVDHAIEYVNGKVHTNGMENFWALLKRTIGGTYVSVDPVHLSAYLDEQVFRFNERKDCDAGRFLKAAKGIVGRGLTWLALTTGKGGEDLLPEPTMSW